MTTDPVVTVLIMTFDHERYINQALESVLTQETEFPYDVIVIDDCSTDGTAEALHRLAERFPGRFTVRRPPANRNDLHDFGVALDDCPSPYVAMLDGDDYWTSTTKLARQVALLELHPEYALSCHAVHPINADGTFSPSELSVPAGEKVTFKAAPDAGTHAVRFGSSTDTFTISGGLIETFTISEPGTYTVTEDLTNATMTLKIT